MSMDMIKANSMVTSYKICNFFAELDLRKLVLGLMLLYALLCFLAPDVVSYAAGFNGSSDSTNYQVGTGSGTDLPWESPMYAIQKSLTGPMAKAIAMIVVVVAGIFVSLGEGGPAGRLVGRLVFGLGLLFGALQIIDKFMGN